MNRKLCAPRKRDYASARKTAVAPVHRFLFTLSRSCSLTGCEISQTFRYRSVCIPRRSSFKVNTSASWTYFRLCYRLDYKPLFGKMSLHSFFPSFPAFSGGSKTGPETTRPQGLVAELDGLENCENLADENSRNTSKFCHWYISTDLLGL